jgi:hypothetical protein
MEYYIIFLPKNPSKKSYKFNKPGLTNLLNDNFNWSNNNLDMRAVMYAITQTNNILLRNGVYTLSKKVTINAYHYLVKIENLNTLDILNKLNKQFKDFSNCLLILN